MTDSAEVSPIESEARSIAAEIYDDKGVEIWMNARNRLFDGQTPLDLIARGEGQRVINLLNQLADGNFA